MRIGLYLDNRNLPDVDLSEPEKGNPGIGGTQFNFITLPYYYQKIHPETSDVILCANHTDQLPPDIKTCRVFDCTDAAEKCAGAGCDLFVYRPGADVDEEKGITNVFETRNINAIAWLHSTPSIPVLNLLSDCEKIKRTVFVGREQLDVFRDHPVFNKSRCILNGFDASKYLPSGEIEKKGDTVVYLGSLIPAKGFHYLARVWPIVKKNIPEAKLIVVGSGKLYNRHQTLGRWHVADEAYEANYIRPYLSNSDGSVQASVKFVGLLGPEKISILQAADVGVVNPSGATENCPGSALEIQACGTPVVSLAWQGLLDTVVNKKTGLLGKNDNDLYRNIIYLLRNKNVSKKYGRNGIQFVKKRFSYEVIIKEWSKLFSDIYQDIPNDYEPLTQNPFYQYKILREVMRILKHHFPFMRNIPPIVVLEPLLKSLYQRAKK